MQISSLGKKVAGSETLAIGARSLELRQQGIDVVSFATGEPDFDTPEFIKDAARAALQSGYTKYTAAAGAPELRQAIAEKLARDNRVEVSPAQVVVTAGAKQALYLAFQAVLEPGDEVIIPAPYWVSFPQQVLLCQGVPVVAEARAEDGFLLSRQALEAALTVRSRALILNSPCNPTGAVYPPGLLAELMEVAEKHDLWVISDETYEALTYDGYEHVSPASFSAQAKARTILTHSFSKSYAMTGWRVGYLAAPAEVASAAGRIASHTTSNVNSIAQKAALAALQGPKQALEEMRRTFDERRKAMLTRLRSIPGITCNEPYGAFYVLPNVEGYLGRAVKGKKVQDSSALAHYLLEQAGVALVPGSAFGAEGYLRLSYATGLDSIDRGLARMAEALGALV